MHTHQFMYYASYAAKLSEVIITDDLGTIENSIVKRHVWGPKYTSNSSISTTTDNSGYKQSKTSYNME